MVLRLIYQACDYEWLCNATDFNLIITSQADIDNGALRHNDNNSTNNQILVRDAKGTLTFTNLTAFYGMTIACNHELQKIVFPDLTHYGALGIYEAPLLREIDMKDFKPSWTALSIHKTPQLGQDPEVQLLYNHDILGLELFDAGHVEFPNMINVKSLAVSDTNASFPVLETISIQLDVASPHKGIATFRALKYVPQLRTGNGTYTDWNGLISPVSMLGYVPSTELAVNHSMAIQPWKKRWAPDWSADLQDLPVNIVPEELKLTQLIKVGEDLNITKNNGIRKLSFGGLTSVKRLNIMDNPNSTIPGDFSSLMTANSIYINGVIDKYVREYRNLDDWTLILTG
ncbi:hypothetical protein PG984_014591 [Apiospora sp. TS-2023a]